MKVNIRILKSISGSVTLKLVNGVISLVAVPLLLKVLGTEDYALWVTLTALVAWITLFDFGAGFSLKNKVSEGIAKNDIKMLYSLVAGTLQFYLFATIVLFLVFIISLFFVKAFSDHTSLVLLIYIPIILSFPFTLGNFILQGLRKFNILNIFLSLQAFLWLLIILFFKFSHLPAKLPVLAVLYAVLYFTINSIMFIYAIKSIKFDWKYVLSISHFVSAKTSIFVGLQFFALQISTLVLYSIGNILTYNHLTLKNVAQYDTVNKLFLMGMTLFNVVISVYWAEISHAKALKDYVGLQKIFKNLLLIAGVFSIGTISVTFFFPFFIKIWTSNMINIELIEFVPFILLVIIQSFAYCGAVFLNAFEILKGQIVFSVTASILMMPLTNYLFKLNYGISSVPLASALLTLPTCIYVLVLTKKQIKSISVV